MKQYVFKAEHLVSGYDKKIIVNDVSLVIPGGKVSVLIGANASGKSTLLKTLSRLIKPVSGEITLNNERVDKIPSKKLAKIVGLLPQSPTIPEGIAVADLVGRGRFPHQSFFNGWSREDSAAVADALDMMGIADLANRNIDELSGGQRQRVWIAMALAQQTDILFLDEPTTFLDIAHQVEILDIITDLNKKFGTTIVMVLHDINLSARYADYIFALQAGKIIAEGSPDDVINAELVKQVFDLDCNIMKDPVSNSPFLIPKGRHHVAVP